MKNLSARSVEDFNTMEEQWNDGKPAGFKHMEDEDKENCRCGEDLIARMNNFHDSLMSHVSLNALQEPYGQELAEPEIKAGALSKLYNIINTVKELEEEAKAIEEEPRKTPEEKFRKVLIQTIFNWAEESQIETPKLVREMFSLLVRQYDAVGELDLCHQRENETRCG